MFDPLASVVLLLAAAGSARADSTENLWATFIYSMYGDRTPFVTSDANVLTPLGAQQAYSGGSFFRDRYLSSNSSELSTSYGLSKYEISSEEITILSTADQYILASAQAFLQGLYPPVLSSSDTYTNSDASLANGSQVDFPLGGYQYPSILAVSPYDYNSIFVAGQSDCAAYSESDNEYYNSQAFNDILVATQNYYLSLEAEAVQGIFGSGALGYFDAYYIYDYLQYEYTHNATLNSIMSDSDIAYLRYLASELVFQMNGNLTASDNGDNDYIRAVGGRTLAMRILESFDNAVEASGSSNQMTLLFGSFEPLIAFFSLAGLSDFNTDFMALPDLASSMVLELFSITTDNDTSFPESINDLYVRFLFRNGTDDSDFLYSYPLLGQSPSQIDIPYTEFVSALEDFQIGSVENWCNVCGGDVYFCGVYNTESAGSSSGSSDGSSGNSYGLNPAIAGVIGALCGAIFVGAGMLIFNAIRRHREARPSTSKKSGLRGFKGGERMRSDQDLTLQGADKSGMAVVTVEGAEGAPAAHGHERVGSWELKANNKETGRGAASAHVNDEEEEDLAVNPFTKPVQGSNMV